MARFNNCDHDCDQGPLISLHIVYAGIAATFWLFSFAHMTLFGHEKCIHSITCPILVYQLREHI
jgi:hypothetical protein